MLQHGMDYNQNNNSDDDNKSSFQKLQSMYFQRLQTKVKTKNMKQKGRQQMICAHLKPEYHT